MKYSSLFIASALVFGVAGCVTLPAVKKEANSVDATVQKTDPAIKAAAAPSDAVGYGRVKISKAVFIGGVSHKVSTGDRLPRKFDREGITLVSSRPVGLQQIGDMILRSTGIPVTLAPELSGFSFASDNSGGNSMSQDRPESAKSGSAVPPPPPSSFNMNQAIAAVNSRSGGGADASRTMRVHFTGPLTSFLNLVGSNFDVTWKYENGTLSFYRLVTRTFTIAAMPTEMTLESSMKAGSQSNSSGSSSSSVQAGSQQQAKVDMSLQLWKELENTIKGMVGKQGFYAVSKTTGTITVSAPFNVIDQIGDYIELQNQKFMRQVAISVQVLNVSLTNSDTYNLDIQGIFNNSAVGASVGAMTPFDLTNASAGIASTLLGTAGLNGLNVGVLNPQSNYFGSNGLVQALSKIGKVSVVTTASVTTMSGVPVPLQVSNTRNYVQSISSTLSNGTSQSSVNTDKVNTGFSLNVLPKVMPDGDVMLQYGVNISELVGADNGFDVFKVDNNSVQLPNINQRSFIQQNLLKTGSTLVLAGFEQVRNQMSKSGTGSADMPWLGGGQSGTGQRDMLVIMITPVILKTPDGFQTASAN